MTQFALRRNGHYADYVHIDTGTVWLRWQPHYDLWPLQKTPNRWTGILWPKARLWRWFRRMFRQVRWARKNNANGVYAYEHIDGWWWERFA